MKSQPKIEDRKIFLDYLRVIATFSVIILHVAASNWYSVDVNSIKWHIFNLYDSISRWGVPVFLMISGSLFLNREINISSIYSKYVLRLLTCFMIWSFVYFLFTGDSIFTQFLSLIKDGKTQQFVILINSHYHLWFIPMMVGIYICIPIINQIIKNITILKYYLMISFVFSFLLPQLFMLINDFCQPKITLIAGAIQGNILNMQMNLIQGYTFYFILGYYLSNKKFNKKQKYSIYVLGFFAFIFTIIIHSYLSIKFQKPIGTYYGNFNVNVLLQAICLFELFKNISFKTNNVSNYMQKLSKWSFGIYLVHALIIELMEKIFRITTLSFSPIFSVPILSIIVFIVSLLISMILNMIPILKKYTV